MKEIKLDHSILSPTSNAVDLNSYETKFTKFIKEFSYVDVGTKLFEFKYKDSICSVFSDTSGVIAYPITRSVKEGQVLYQVYDSYHELVEHLFANTYEIVEDDFTKEKHIKWRVYSGYRGDLSVYRYGEGFRLNMYFATLNLNISRGNPIIQFLFNTNKQNGIRVKKNDTVSLLFADGSILDFIVSQKPYKTGAGITDTAIDLMLKESDIVALREKNLAKMRITFANGDAPATLTNNLSGSFDVSYLLLQRYVKEYESILDCLGVKWEHKHEESITPSIKGHPSDPCYVYLMVDKANGYHKIGISNHPEYREGTLQSEKPTIELVCAKQYPSRIIASAIESALHSAFGGKRLRGEWFDLSENEVNDIKLTLR